MQESSLNLISVLNPLDLTCQSIKSEISSDIILIPLSLLTIVNNDVIPFKVGPSGELILANLNYQNIIEKTTGILETEKTEQIQQPINNDNNSVKIKDLNPEYRDKSTIDLINFISHFKSLRIKWNLFQSQISDSLKHYNNFPVLSQSFLSRFEKLEITLKSAQNVEPFLRIWLINAEELYKLYSVNYEINENVWKGDPEKLREMQTFILDHSRFSSTSAPNPKGVTHNQFIPRKRRTVFTPVVVKKLTTLFKANQYPKGEEVLEISKTFDINQESIMQWFRNQRRKLLKTNHC